MAKYMRYTHKLHPRTISSLRSTGHEKVREILGNFSIPRHYPDIFIAHVIDGRPGPDVAKEHGVTRATVHNVKKTVVRKLLNNRKLLLGHGIFIPEPKTKKKPQTKKSK